MALCECAIPAVIPTSVYDLPGGIWPVFQPKNVAWMSCCCQLLMTQNG